LNGTAYENRKEGFDLVVFLTAATGLRISEALGLKWSDVDFRSRVINLSRAVVHQQIGETKTEASRKPVPMDGALVAVLHYWSTQTWYGRPDDWVFASPKMHDREFARSKPLGNFLT
jgi:integrase